MKTHNKFLSMVFLLFALNCKSQAIDSIAKTESMLLMSEIFKNFSNNKLNPSLVKNRILFKPSIDKYDSWYDLIEECNSILSLAIHYDSKTNGKKVDYTKIFTQNEIVHMMGQANKKEKNWHSYLGINPEKTEKDNYSMIKEYYFTIPVFTMKKNYALIYQEQKHGGSLIIYNKDNGKWKPFGTAMVWVN